MMQATATTMTAPATTAATNETPPPRDSVIHEAARLMRRADIPAEGPVWRVGGDSWVWAARSARGQLHTGNAGSEQEARDACETARSGATPRGPALLP